MPETGTSTIVKPLPPACVSGMKRAVPLECFHMRKYRFHQQAVKHGELAMPMFMQEVCPIEGRRINKRWYVDYKGKRIYFCSPSAPRKFMKDPDRYFNELLEKGVTLEDTPKPSQDHGIHPKGAKKEPAGGYHNPG